MSLATLVCNDHEIAGDVLAERIESLAGAFHQQGVGPGSSVAILLRNGAAFLETTLAAQRLGAYVTPLNWHWTVEEVRHVLVDCGASIIVGQSDLLAGAAAALPAHCLVIEVVGGPPQVAQAPWRDYEAFLAAGPPPPPPCAAPDSIIYTSGTTGKPKGVVRGAPTPEEGAWVVAARNRIYDLRPGMRGLLAAPLYHAAPNQFGVFAAQQTEARLVLHERFDPERFLADIERHAITHAYMAPAMFVRLLALPDEQRRRYDLSSLKFVTHAGGPCAPQIKARMIEWWGPVIHEYYGGTELGPVSFCDSADALTAPGSVGKVLDGVQLRILSPDGEPVATGQVGELYVRTPYFSQFTYHNAPDKRGEMECEGLVSLGDLGRQDAAGFVYLVDRKRDMIISGGVNIYCAEIESALLEQPGVADCAVFGIPDAEFGEAPHALVRLSDNAQTSPARLRSGLETRLARYKIPKAIEIRHSLPRDEAGKLRKAALREPYWADAGRLI